MEENQEQKHCCKFCNKRFACGRSLGGHMRSHMTINSAETDEKKVVNTKKNSVNGGRSNSNSSMGFEGGYGLRENPKKTWRLSDSIQGALRSEKVCKQCGKGGFQSWKALFGHMRCHSLKSSQSLEEEEEEEPWVDKLVLDSQSDNESVMPKKRKRSRRRTRYGTISSSLSVVNAGSCGSEIEQEQEEVAICLMMLSRDVWGEGSNLVAVESSDTHSVILEVRSKGGLVDLVSGGNLTAKMKKPRQKRSEFGLKKMESDDSDNGFLRDLFNKKKMKLDVSDTEFEVSDEELREDSCKKEVANGSDVDLEKGSFKKRGLDFAATQLGNCSLKVMGLDRIDSKLKKGSSYENSNAELGKDHKKRSKYQCAACNKTFHSYQALGGHRASHKKIKGCFASRVDDDENFIDDDIVPDQMAEEKPKSRRVKPIEMGEGVGKASNTSKKSKAHECPICFKVFASGQALGGHKRSHLIGSSEARSDSCHQAIVLQQQLPEIHNLLDLNLPAPIDEDTTEHVGFSSWWVGNGHKHEPLVGLITN